MHQVLADYLLDILHMNKPVPDRIGVDHDDRSMLALIEAPKLIRANLPLQAGVFHRIFES
jgi:hypothetical protein